MSDKLSNFINKLGSKGLHYDDPRLLKLNCVDKKIKKTIKNINKSNWCWTLFSCQGHLRKSGDSLPYIVFVVKNENIDKFLSLLYLTLPISKNKELPLHTNCYFMLSRGFSDKNFSIINLHWSLNYIENKSNHNRLISDLHIISKKMKENAL